MYAEKPLVYLAGPMTGYEDYNYPEFDRWAALLREKGYMVVNPADAMGRDQGRLYREYLAHAVAEVASADVLATLDGWRESRGALLEVVLALSLEKPVIPAEDLWMGSLAPEFEVVVLAEYLRNVGLRGLLSESQHLLAARVRRME